MRGCAPISSGMVYRPGHPRISPLWQCLHRHFYDFIQTYDRYQPAYGYLRPVVEDVVDKFIQCGDLTKGFATARCGTCGQEVVIAFSCKARYLCPSCHQKKVLLFGELIMNQVLFPVPHRQYVFTMPKMPRIYFRNDRSLLGKLAALASQGLYSSTPRTIRLSSRTFCILLDWQSFGHRNSMMPSSTWGSRCKCAPAIPPCCWISVRS